MVLALVVFHRHWLGGVRDFWHQMLGIDAWATLIAVSCAVTVAVGFQRWPDVFLPLALGGLMIALFMESRERRLARTLIASSSGEAHPGDRRKCHCEAVTLPGRALVRAGRRQMRPGGTSSALELHCTYIRASPGREFIIQPLSTSENHHFHGAVASSPVGLRQDAACSANPRNLRLRCER